MKILINGLIIGAVLFLLYSVAGHSYVAFYSGGKEELHELAQQIQVRCQREQACPSTLEGWQPLLGRDGVRHGNMLYLPESSLAAADGADRDEQSEPAPQSFVLIYSFFAPDDWYQAEGGVTQTLSFGWKSR